MPLTVLNCPFWVAKQTPPANGPNGSLVPILLQNSFEGLRAQD